MDSLEDGEFQLSLSGSDIIRELKAAFPRLLFQTGILELSKRQLRQNVNKVRLDHLLRRLDFFQELPQLLDPALTSLLHPLTIALSQCLQLTENSQVTSVDRIATSTAVCKLLYAFCKVRGYKVIIRFFSNEVNHLEPLVNILEALCKNEGGGPVYWEEKYILLLWLSHLILNPFPLSTLGNNSSISEVIVETPWPIPENLSFVHRICSLALFNLNSPSKERDSAVRLFTRLILRPDVYQAGLLDQALLWSVQIMKQPSSSKNIHEMIGVLSSVAAILKSAKPEYIAGHIVPLYEQVRILIERSDGAKVGNSAIIRRLIVKSLRYIVVSADYIARHHIERSDHISYDSIIESSIENLLNCLSDSDSPVRFAASKSISTIAIRLQIEMAEELVEAIVANIEQDIVWDEHNPETFIEIQGGLQHHINLENVNPFHWQGLVLTLAHLLFHKVITPSRLSPALKCLLFALSFEQRTVAGSSTGNIVRDAANFGIWSLARRYSTSELRELDISFVHYPTAPKKYATILQILACELVAAACLDPYGNIRRGASAALQELIGRHPDTVLEGIRLVQTLDYHAVALYTRASGSVALEVAKISSIYQDRLLQDLLTWRGIFAVNPSSRAQAAATYGSIAERKGDFSIAASTSMLWKEVKMLKDRDVSRRHGLLITLAELVAASRRVRGTLPVSGWSKQNEVPFTSLWGVYLGQGGVNERYLTDFSLRPALAAEAVSYLLQELCELGEEVNLPCPSKSALRTAAKFIELSANVSQATAIGRVAAAATAYFKFCKKNEHSLTDISSQWLKYMDRSLRSGPDRQSNLPAWFALLGSIFNLLDPEFRSKAYDLFLLGLSPCAEVETKVATLEAIHYIISSSTHPLQLVMAVKLCLEDYTTDQRGDVGSLVRIAALKCLPTILGSDASMFPGETSEIRGLICGLAVEKLDKVRTAAHECLSSIEAEQQKTQPVNSHNATYFESMLLHASKNFMMENLLLGLSTTISAASDPVSRSSRTGFENFLVSAEENVLFQTLDAVISLLKGRLEDERTITCLLETMAFALGTNVFLPLRGSERAAPKFKSIFMLTQKSHLKTVNISKILASIEVYTYLTNISCVRSSSIRKLLNLLLHPFPAVRQSAAESLFCISQDEALLPVNWTLPPNNLKTFVEKTGASILPQ